MAYPTARHYKLLTYTHTSPIWLDPEPGWDVNDQIWAIGRLSPFQVAIIRGNYGIVRRFVEEWHADVSSVTHGGQTCLELAKYSRTVSAYLRTVPWVARDPNYRRHIDPHIRKYEQLLMHISRLPEMDDVPDVNARTFGGLTYVHLLCAYGQADLLQRAIEERGADTTVPLPHRYPSSCRQLASTNQAVRDVLRTHHQAWEPPEDSADWCQLVNRQMAAVMARITGEREELFGGMVFLVEGHDFDENAHLSYEWFVSWQRHHYPYRWIENIECLRPTQALLDRCAGECCICLRGDMTIESSRNFPSYCGHIACDTCVERHIFFGHVSCPMCRHAF